MYHEWANFRRCGWWQFILISIKCFQMEGTTPEKSKHFNTWKRMAFAKQDMTRKCGNWTLIWSKTYGIRKTVLHLQRPIQGSCPWNHNITTITNKESQISRKTMITSTKNIFALHFLSFPYPLQFHLTYKQTEIKIFCCVFSHFLCSLSTQTLEAKNNNKIFYLLIIPQSFSSLFLNFPSIQTNQTYKFYCCYQSNQIKMPSKKWKITIPHSSELWTQD